MKKITLLITSLLFLLPSQVAPRQISTRTRALGGITGASTIAYSLMHAHDAYKKRQHNAMHPAQVPFSGAWFDEEEPPLQQSVARNRLRKFLGWVAILSALATGASGATDD